MAKAKTQQQQFDMEKLVAVVRQAIVDHAEELGIQFGVDWGYGDRPMSGPSHALALQPKGCPFEVVVNTEITYEGLFVEDGGDLFVGTAPEGNDDGDDWDDED